MSQLHEYEFRATWHFDYPKQLLWRVFLDVPGYVHWWPLVREVTALDKEGDFRYRCRAILPYDLNFDSFRDVVDENNGVLKASMAGDLAGYTQWTVKDEGTSCRVEFLEVVTLEKPILRKLAPVAKPFFKLNHVVSMRQGLRGLRTYLAGIDSGKQFGEIPINPS